VPAFGALTSVPSGGPVASTGEVLDSLQAACLSVVWGVLGAEVVTIEVSPPLFLRNSLHEHVP
jgi:hypothetical protein